MAQKRELDPLLEWGAEAAMVVLIAGLLGAVALVIYTLMQGGALGSAALPALGVAMAGSGLSFLIMRLRKQRERARRPEWMGHTQQWREEMQLRQDGKGKTPAGEG